MSIPYPPGEPLTCQQLRELDILAIEHVGIPGLVLMENAARAVADFAYGLLPNPPRANTVILCGPGNNGGDGLAVARHLRNAGVPVKVALAAPRARIKGDAAINLGIYQRLEDPLFEATVPEELERLSAEMRAAELVIDGLLGTGAGGPPRGVMAELIRLANAAPRARRVAIDIPSGLDADTGTMFDPCFLADATVTFVAPKVGFGSESARRALGRVVVADIGAPRELIPGRKEIGEHP